MKKQSLKQALFLAHSGKSGAFRCGLDGCPVGGWGDTQQAKARLAEALPPREQRAYTVAEFIDAAYDVDHADRYRVKVKG